MGDSTDTKQHTGSGPSNSQALHRKATKNTNGGTVLIQSGCSGAQADWDYQKQFQGAQSDKIDSLMEMIGLEEVKAKFLTIKAQVDTAIRQNVDLKDERFGTVLVGNPGTGMWILCTLMEFISSLTAIGKTRIARLYAKFPSSIGVLPGSTLEETTGSWLANDGVSGCEKLVNDILNKGGGILFIYEAYQLTEGHSYGTKVVDYLLGEVGESWLSSSRVIEARWRDFSGRIRGFQVGSHTSSSSITAMTSCVKSSSTESPRSMAGG